MTIFVNLEQRTQEWFDWRKSGITATESPIIAGLSPYCSAWHLWGEKTGKLKPREVNAFAVKRGVENESVALQLWIDKHGIEAMPACCEWSKDRKYRASCDGLTLSGEPVEIKCFGEEHLKEIREQGLQAKCLQYCVMQVHHQILVTEAPRGHLVFYDPSHQDGFVEFEIPRDEAILEGIVARGDEFWSFVQSGKEPPYPKDVFIPRGETRQEWARAARDYREAQAQLDLYANEIAHLKTKLEDLEKKLRSMMPEDETYAEFGGVIVQRINAQGSIDYKKAYAALPESSRFSDAELEQYRRAPSVRWKFAITTREVPDDVIDEKFVEPLVLKPRESLWF